MTNRLRQLNPQETEQLGRFCATLLDGSKQWVFRRKESVTVIDEATIRRQQSVDFSLDTIRSLNQFKQVCEQVFGHGLCAAPLFILDKDPASSLSFDLKDETGRTLSLMSSEENTEISAATLKVLCQEKLAQHLSRPLPTTLAAKLDKLAKSNTTHGREWLDRLEKPLAGDADLEEIQCLLDTGNDQGNVKWWLETLAVASIVMVTFDAGLNHRRVIKIAYEQPMASGQRLAAKLAIRSFKVWLFAPLIRGGRYHFDVTAPPDFRLTQVALFDSKATRPTRTGGFRRRAQLYLDDVHEARGAIAMFAVRVSGRGVLGGALVAAFLALLAIVACIWFREDIAKGSTDNTAVLLVLPGIIATYVARSDQHGLTTRLLAIPRWILLLGSGVAAYYAAGVLALIGQVEDGLGPKQFEEMVSQKTSLLLWLLLPAAVCALVSVLVIFAGWMCTREKTHSLRNRMYQARRRYARPRFRFEHRVRVDLNEVWNHIQAEVASLQPKGLFTQVWPRHKCSIHRVVGPVSWTHGITLTETPTGTHVNWRFQAEGPWYAQPFLVGMVFRELAKAKGRIAEFEQANASG